MELYKLYHNKIFRIGLFAATALLLAYFWFAEVGGEIAAVDGSVYSGYEAVKMNKKITKEFEKEIAPFFWVEHEESASACLNVGEYLQEIFDTREDEGFEGSGYDWGSLAQVFLDEQCSDLQEKIGFDPEGSMFCVYSKDKDVLADFILRFKKACEDKPFILDLFSRAELD